MLSVPLLILGALPLALSLQQPEACHSCVPSSVREDLAIGFDLGQSYG